MENSTQKVFKSGNIALFVGLTLSGSMAILNLSKQYLDPPILFSIFTVVSILLMTIQGLARFYMTARPQQILQFSEYILSLLATFLVLEHCKEIQLNLDNTPLLCLLAFYITMILILFKILFIDQRFIFDQEWSFISGNKYFRMVRAGRLMALPILYAISSFQIMIIIIVCISIAQFLVVLKYFNYQNIFHQTQTFTAIIISFCSLFQTFITRHYGLSYLFVSQVIAVILYTFYKQIRLTTILFEKKFIALVSRNMKLQSYIQKIMLLQTIREVVFLGVMPWSQKFIQQIQVYVLKLEQQSKNNSLQNQEVLSNNLSNYSRIHDKNNFYSLLQTVLFSQNQYAIRVEQLDYFTYLTASKSRRLVNLCLIKYHNMRKNRKVFFLKKFIQKVLKSYINYFSNLYDQTDPHHQSIINFQIKIISFRDKVIQGCKKDISFAQKLGRKQYGQSVGLKTFIERYFMKKKLEDKLEDCFSMPYYYCSQDFLYIYLNYAIIYCKNIAKTKKILREKFLMLMKSISSQSKQITNSALLVCASGAGNNQLGQIVNSNSNFRKKYLSNLIRGKRKSLNISQFIPKSLSELHITKFNQYLKFHNEQMPQHSNYQSYIISFFGKKSCLKKVSIHTKVYYSFFEDIHFVCVFEENEDKKYYVEINCQDGVRDVSNQEVGVEKQVNIMGKKMLIGIYKVADEESAKINLYQQQNDSIKSINSEDYQAQDVCLTEDREVKIEYQIPKTKQEAKIICKLFVIWVVIFAAIFTIISQLDAQIQRSQQQMQRNINFEKNTFKDWANNQQKITFLLLLLREIRLGTLGSKYCQSFGIQNLDKFSSSLLDSIASGSYDEYEGHFPKESVDLQRLIIQRKYKFFQLDKQQLKVSLKKYQSLLKSFVYESRLINFKNQDPEQLQHFLQNMEKLIHLDNNAPNQSLYDITTFIDDRIKYSLMILLIILLVKVFLLFSFVVISIYIIYRIEKQIIKILKLINCLNEDFANKRINECQHIIKCINSDIKVSNQDVELKNAELIYLSSPQMCRTLKVQQYESTPEAYNQRRFKTQSYQSLQTETQQQKTFCYEALHQNRIFLMLFGILILVLIGISLLRTYFCSQKLTYMQRYSNYEQNIQLLQKNLYKSLTATWLQFTNDRYIPVQVNNQMYNKSLDFLINQNIKTETMQIFTPQISSSILHNDICSGLEDQEMANKCIVFEGGIMTFGLIDLIPYYYKNLIILKNSKLGYANINDSKINSLFCRSISVGFNFTSPAFAYVHNSGYDQISLKFDNREYLMDSLSTAIFSIFLGFLAISGYVLYMVLKIVKRQILTLDIPKNLFKYQEFYPHLNRLIYKF